MNYTRRVVVSVILIQAALLSALSTWGAAADVVLAVVLVLATFFFVERALTLLILYVSVLPTVAWAGSIPFIPFVLRNEVAFLIVLLAFFYLLIQKLMEGRVNLRMTSMDLAFAVFLLLIVFSWTRGQFKGYPKGFVKGEFLYLISYGAYFIVANSAMNERWIGRFWAVLTLGSLIASLEYVVAMFAYPAMIKVSTRLAHSAQVSLPYLMMLFLTFKGWKRKGLSLAAMLAIVTMVLISLQRGIWVGVFVSWSIILVWFLWRSYAAGIRAHFTKILIFGLIGLVVVAAVVGRIFSDRIQSLTERAETFYTLRSDPSLYIRLDEVFQAMSQVKSIWIGNGLGDYIYQRIRGVQANFVDNSYFFFIWKMGIVGLLAYLAIIFLLLRRCIFIYRRATDESLRWFAIMAMSSFIGLQLLAQATACVAVYEFNPVWAILIGTVEVAARRLEER